MNTNFMLEKTITPEEFELEDKISELHCLQDELSGIELDLATLQVELETFHRRYMRLVGVKLAELDDILARIAEQEASQHPGDKTAKAHAERLRETAGKTHEEAFSEQEKPEAQKFRPSVSLKELYRAVAKQIHPDLADNDADRKIRTELMAKANEAYANKDEAKLREILEEWRNRPESIEGETVAAELARTIRQINLIKKRLREVEMKFLELENSDVFKLKVKVEEAELTGRNLLAEMLLQIERQIDAARSKLRGGPN